MRKNIQHRYVFFGDKRKKSPITRTKEFLEHTCLKNSYSEVFHCTWWYIVILVIIWWYFVIIWWYFVIIIWWYFVIIIWWYFVIIRWYFSIISWYFVIIYYDASFKHVFRKTKWLTLEIMMCCINMGFLILPSYNQPIINNSLINL